MQLKREIKFSDGKIRSLCLASLSFWTVNPSAIVTVIIIGMSCALPRTSLILLSYLIIKQVSPVYLLYHVMWYPMLSRCLILIEPRG